MAQHAQYVTLVPVAQDLHGERIRLRAYRADDASALYTAVGESRAHLAPWLPFANSHQQIEETRDLIAHWQARWILREELEYGIWQATSGEYLGAIGLHPRDWDARAFEIGYWLRTGREGHGYMTEAVRVLSAYAFTDLRAQRVEIRCDARNAHSANVARRCGFVREAHLRNHKRAPDGTLRDTLIFARTPADRDTFAGLPSAPGGETERR